MKRLICIVAAVSVCAAFALTILAHAGDLPPIPLTTASSTPTRIVDLLDVAVLARHLAGGWNVTIDADAANVNGDGTVDLKDVVLIRRYLAGGWNVTLL